MDSVLGSLIDDFTLFRIIAVINFILILAVIYLVIQVTLAWKFMQKEEVTSDKVISNKRSFYKSLFFIFIGGFFMLSHEFLEGLKENSDSTTYEFFELIALLGLVLFLFDWNKILKNRHF
ncbi:Uncharacterised protein [uncultured archaeon]|nr:Uncharacterised protein [uncultured archaeon]